MNSSKIFGRYDNIAVFLPSALLLLFLYIELYEPINSIYKISTAELFFLIAIVSYPLGTILEQLAISIRAYILKGTKYSDDFLLLRYLQCDIDEFWVRYIKFYTEANPILVSMVSRENLNKFFFLNMITVTIISLFVHVLVTKQVINIVVAIQVILIIVFLKYHFQCQGYFYYIFNMATQSKRSLRLSPTAKLLKHLKK